MASIDSIEKQLVPELPKTIDNEQTTVYVPIASDKTPGIAAFESSDFVITKDGKVQLKYSQKSLVRNANPLETPSYVKLSKDEFESVRYPNENYPFAELQLRRDADANNAFEKPSFIKLDANDFNLTNVDGVNVTSIVWPVNPFIDSSKLSFKFADKYFKQQEDKTIVPAIPRANTDELDDGFGTVKIFTENKYLYFKDDGTLAFDDDLAKSVIQNTDVMYIQPNYEIQRLEYLDVDPNTGNKTVAKRQAYFTKDTIVDDKTYFANAEVPELLDTSEIDIYYRTVLKIDKTSVGLGLVENISLTEKLNDFEQNADAKYTNANEFGNYKFANDNELAKINSDLQYLLNQKASKAFLGYIINQNGTPFKAETDEGYISNEYFLQQLGHTILADKLNPNAENINVDTYIVFANSGNIAYVYSPSNFTVLDEERYWKDSGISSSTLKNYLDYMATDALGYASEILKPDGIASYGTMPYFAPIDHVHPENENVLLWKINNDVRSLIINDVATQLGNATKDINIELPDIDVTKHIHNWNGDFVGGVPNYKYSKDKFVKTWVGTYQEYMEEFAGNAPADVLVYITDDTFNFEGDLLDVNTFNEKTNEFLVKIKGNAQAGKTYIYSPLAQNDFVWTEFNKGDYVPNVINTDLNIQITTNHSLRINARNVATLAQMQEGSVPYMAVVPTIANGQVVELGNSTGRYVSLSEARTSIVTEIDNKYSSVIADIDADIDNLQRNVDSIDLSAYLTKSVYNSDKATFALKSELNAKISRNEAIDFVDVLGQSHSGTFNDIASLLKYANTVYYKNNTTIQTNSLKFVVCTESEYNSLTKDANTLYFITE